MLSVLQKIQPETLRSKLLLWYTGVFAVSAVALALGTYAFTARQLKAEAQRFLEDETEEFARQVQARMPDLDDLRKYMRLEIGEKRHYRPFYRLFDADNRDILAMPEASDTPSVNQDLLGMAWRGTDPVVSAVSGGGGFGGYVVQTAKVQAAGKAYVAQCGFLITKLHERLTRLRVFLALSIPAILVVAGLGGLLVSGRSVKMVSDVVANLRDIRSANLSRRLPTRNVDDEIGFLTQAINSMLDELESAFERTSAFTADVAHELRTPLSALRCELEVAIARERTADEYRESLTSVLDRTTGLAHVVENLLFLARADAAPGLPESAPVDLSTLLDEVAEEFELAAEDKALAFERRIGRGLCAMGNATWLKMLFANLLDNAVKYTPSCGSIGVLAEERSERLWIGVKDTGPGIDPESRAKVFDKFYRASKSRSRDSGGVGLGLSIASRIAALHGGRIEVQSEPGRGSLFVVWLPISKKACAGADGANGKRLSQGQNLRPKHCEGQEE